MFYKNLEIVDEMIFYHDDKIFATRKGAFKLYYKNNPEGYRRQLEKPGHLQLFNVQQDPSERHH